MKIFQKFIVIITIISLLISPVFNILVLRPKQVKALDAGGSWAMVIKETVLDAIGWTVSDMIIKPLEQRIMNWGLGRTTDTNQPFPVLDWGKFFQEALDIGSAMFIAKFNATALCYPIKISLGDRPEFSWYHSELGYEYMAACTLGDVVDNVEDFFRNPQIGFYGRGMGVWLDLMNPQNNIYGSWLMASEERERMEAEEERNADKRTAVSGGVENETVTTKTDTEACKSTCSQESNQSCIDKCGGRAASEQCVEDCLRNQVQACEQKCDATTGGIAIEKKVKNLGADIHKQLDNAMSADMQRIISADEISELIGIIFSALINKTISGISGLFGSIRQTTATASQRNRDERQSTFSYQRGFKKTQTTKDINTVRSQILTNILKAMQQLDRSIIACAEDEMMYYTDWSKNVADVTAPNVEALYIGLEGVNLKPDFEVLDPRFAPYTVYGYSWGEMPAVKIPDKCREVINQYYTETLGQQNPSLSTTCQNITSGLEPLTPTRASLEQIQQQQETPRHTSWTTNPTEPCSQCMYDHDPLNCPPVPYPPQPYPQGANPVEPWTDLVHQQKDEFWWACKSSYNAVINRCEDCLKKADEKCGQFSEEQKEQCILDNCGWYEDLTERIVGSITDGLDFYNKCLVEERKEACYVCLKEYFMPATYCEETADYIVRAIDKYPALVKRNVAGGDDCGEWWGPYDTGEGGRGGECDDNCYAQSLDVSLLCRIMPDFAYGGQSCRTLCMGHGMTEEQLRDITDGRPNGIDCNRATVPIGGRDSWNAVNDGTYRIRGKCCAAFWQHDRDKYAICVGAGTSTAGEPPSGPCTYAVPVGQEPWCYCGESERPIANAKNGRPFFQCKDGKCPLPCNEETDCGNTCGSNSFEVPNMTRLKDAYFISNAAPGGSVMFIAKDTCSDPDGSSCEKKSSSAMLINGNKLALALEKSTNKTILPYILAVEGGDCNCGADPDCLSNERCDLGATCTPTGMYNGLCISSTPPPPPTCSCASPDHYCDEISGGVPGWHDPPLWGGCGTCPGASQTPPKGCVALSYCDGCCFDYDWNNMKCVDAPTGPCDYIAKGPSQVVCQKETYNSSSSKRCCSQCGGGLIGTIDMTCDLSDYIGQTLNIGSYNNQESDCVTGVLLCVPCDPSDPGYPNYGTNYNQCTGKI